MTRPITIRSPYVPAPARPRVSWLSIVGGLVATLLWIAAWVVVANMGVGA